jgi:long-subunit fatty acid transport protein
MGYTGGNNALVVERDMEDTWHWSVGIEYQALDWLALRAGYEKRPTSTQKDYWDAIYFLPDMEFYGAGVGFRLPKDVKIDLGVGYLRNESMKIDNNESTNMNSTDFTRIVYNPFAGLDYEQETYIYIASFGVTMPLQVQMDLLHHQMETVKHLFHKLNPFSKEDEKGEQPEEDKDHHETH